MKNLIFIISFFLIAVPMVLAQCAETFPLPYFEDVEDTEVPFLPSCMSSNVQTPLTFYAFETLSGPIAGFDGNVFVLDTALIEEFMLPESTGILVSLLTPNVELEQGIAYTVSCKYGNSMSNKTISMLAIEIEGTNITIGEIANITGATAANYVSAEFTPPVTGIYKLNFRVYSISTQGLLYLDDIRIEETGVMNVKENTLDGLLLYPNPVTESLSLEYIEPIDSVKIYSIAGELVASFSPYNKKPVLNIGNLASGTYTVTVMAAGRTKSTRIIKE